MREAHDSESQTQAFVQNLGFLLTSWEATTFLIGEYTEAEVSDNPVFTVADGIIWLYQIAERNSTVRKLQIMKLARPDICAGAAHIPHIRPRAAGVFPYFGAHHTR